MASTMTITLCSEQLCENPDCHAIFPSAFGRVHIQHDTPNQYSYSRGAFCANCTSKLMREYSIEFAEMVN